MSDFTAMVDSSGSLNDAAQLRNRIEVDGYLFFQQLVDGECVTEVKQEIMEILRKHFIIEDDGAPDPMWSGGPQPTEVEYMEVYDSIVDLESFQRLAHAPQIIAVLEAVCGEEVQVWEQQLIRIVYPAEKVAAANAIGAHQDGDPKLGYKASRFYTGWISLMQIDATVGGLAVAPRSHTKGLLKSQGNVASSTAMNQSLTYGLDVTKLKWATAEFIPGSVVLFSHRTAHRGLPNHSDRIRLSCDFRYQACEDSASWLAHTRGPDVRRTAQKIDEVLSSRAFYVTTRATPDLIDKIRQCMLEERNSTLGRAQKLALDLG